MATGISLDEARRKECDTRYPGELLGWFEAKLSRMVAASNPKASANPRSPQSPSAGSDLRKYVREHEVEPLLAEALKAACDEQAEDPIAFIGNFMLNKRGMRGGGQDGEGQADALYVKQSALGVAQQVGDTAATRWRP